MKLLFLIAAIVVFIIAAILAFFQNPIHLDNVLGLTNVGLALLAAAFLPLAEALHRA